MFNWNAEGTHAAVVGPMIHVVRPTGKAAFEKWLRRPVLMSVAADYAQI
jgi:hypothetical protein